ncbi:MAG: hypothetical protein GEU95_01205 [Rhizobiales bacterium]|nr:hypothetical protein [Hyphomicrobiales bacterium]
MALFHSSYVRGGERVPAPQWAGDVVAVRFEYTLPTAEQITGNIIELGVLPAYARPIDAVLDSDALAASALVLDVGIMSGDVGEALDEVGAARTSGDELFDGITTGVAGGVVRPTLAKAFRVAPAAKDRSIGLKIATQGVTPAEGKIGLTVFYGT